MHHFSGYLLLVFILLAGCSNPQLVELNNHLDRKQSLSEFRDLPEKPVYERDPNVPLGILNEYNEPPSPSIIVQNVWQQYDSENQLIQVFAGHSKFDLEQGMIMFFKTGEKWGEYFTPSKNGSVRVTNENEVENITLEAEDGTQWILDLSTRTFSKLLTSIELPETVDLDFKPIERTILVEQEPKSSWEFIKTVPFGFVDNQEVTLQIYKDYDEEYCSYGYKTQLVHQDKSYSLADCISARLVVETETISQDERYYLLQHKFGEEKDGTYLLGGIELAANGPGLVGYLMYDKAKDTWQQFDDWGIPYLVDLDSDGNKEFVIQFPGMHLQFPDVDIYRWNKGSLEKGKTLSSALNITDYNPSYIYMEEKADKVLFSVDVNVTRDSELSQLAIGLYRYEDGKLHLFK